ncbi:hypothetical protein [Amycolatopsis speibonae]|uniref:PilZ domain-containing protein n=1 Tax=Amycolatopsis speibonae TaxID=1450224 RepID=A0ABV7PB74_9PSEU
MTDNDELVEALRAVGILEEVLSLDAGVLHRLLGSRRPRGRGVRSAKPLDRFHRGWGHPAFLRPLLDEFRDRLENPVRKLDLRETFQVTADRCARRIVVRELTEARQDRTRTMIVAARSRPGVPPPVVVESGHCRPGTVLTLDDEGFSLTELVLDRTLRRGERLAVGFVQEYPRPMVTGCHHRKTAGYVRGARSHAVARGLDRDRDPDVPREPDSPGHDGGRSVVSDAPSAGLR